MSEQQKIIVSVSGSVIGHALMLIVIFVVLTSNWMRGTASNAKEKETGPKEVTVMLSDLMEQIEPPLAPEKRESSFQKRFVNTDDNIIADTKPENAKYESDRNTVAASKPRPDASLPKAEGVTMHGDERVRTLELQERMFAKNRADESRPANGEETKLASQKVFTDANSRSAARAKRLKSEIAASGIPVVKRKNSVNGTLTNKGEDAVDAVDTPLGRYKKSVTDAVAVKWHKYRKESAEPITWGTLRLKFVINPEGKVQGLKVTENEGNELLLDLTLKAISETVFQPMSDEVSAQLGASGLAMKYDVIIY